MQYIWYHHKNYYNQHMNNDKLFYFKFKVQISNYFKFKSHTFWTFHKNLIGSLIFTAFVFNQNHLFLLNINIFPKRSIRKLMTHGKRVHTVRPKKQCYCTTKFHWCCLRKIQNKLWGQNNPYNQEKILTRANV